MWTQSASDAALEKQKSELARLAAILTEKETALTVGQARLDEEASFLHQELGRAVGLSEQVVKDQGSAVERLKKVISVLRRLQVTLKTGP